MGRGDWNRTLSVERYMSQSRPKKAEAAGPRP